MLIGFTDLHITKLNDGEKIAIDCCNLNKIIYTLESTEYSVHLKIKNNVTTK